MSAPPRRIRRSAPDSRLAILQAAEARLIAEGPDGVRVQPLARELGLTDAAVHYHFGSREKLLEALLRYSSRRFVDEMAAALAAARDDGFDLAKASALLADFYDTKGAGRLAMWLHFSGWRPEGAGMLAPLVDWLHGVRTAQAAARGEPVPDREESQYAIALLSTQAMGQALLGDAVLRSVGLAGDKAPDFTAWLAGVLAT